MQKIIQFSIDHIFLLIVWLITFSILIFTVLQKFFSKAKEISKNEAIYLINRKKAVVLDLRNASEYKSGHIINSINIEAKNIKIENINFLKKFKNYPIIVVGITEIYAYYPAKKLFKLGFDKIYILKEGISGWIRENLPIVKK
ncbi:rhodanese-like domain-containing protein [bacterium endosymbiont of Pedicinus badii]|uniref:rhodanese-like domain-containing protein n=1 Tax=bacterium endosymbiont of Pedicinus badii TaxID=1719126 RepID=UPI0009B94035|nr:rhodanese-like domain-containing protein [bacterium endosymbiont of Pedicinus badii]OQM34057.1 hypothetical protein AOQ89_01720 [bacterium endosymbiont of Pedicinus badii]